MNYLPETSSLTDQRHATAAPTSTPTFETRPSKLRGLAPVAAGVVAIVAYVLVIGFARVGGVAERHTWPREDGPVYLTSAVRGGDHRCTITPASGEPVRESTSACPDAAPVSRGWLVRPYPVGEQWLVLAGGLLLVILGLRVLGLFSTGSCLRDRGPATFDKA